MISDRFGRRAALIGAITVANCGFLLAALAPNVGTYLVARHFTGAGAGSTSLTAYVLGTEYCPRKSATRVKSAWSVQSCFGTGALALSSWAYTGMPGYNWRVLSFLGPLPIFLCGFVAAAFIDESPRWTLVSKGEAAALELLRKVAARNGGAQYVALVDSAKLRLPPKEVEQTKTQVGGGAHDRASPNFCG